MKAIDLIKELLFVSEVTGIHLDKLEVDSCGQYDHEKIRIKTKESNVGQINIVSGSLQVFLNTDMINKKIKPVDDLVKHEAPKEVRFSNLDLTETK